MDNQDKSNQRMCHGECAKCSFQQRVYCASYMSRNNYAMMESVLAKLDYIQSEIDEMKQKVNAIQSNEGELIRPFQEEQSEEVSTIKASGAENRLPKQSTTN